ncbi:monovalent cation/H(+) antiporter subunit G [Corynebacterium guangdongense]|uniref:Multicomponent Na+:H+ antiporter subunit G n=1 Tax=Corynebacterium guangdongense TaxID=1783348 RepID=A0ABU1ZZH5_9CORY|nr:monovalent cation/H(+) antiporter subunit G [Corynebacterium guangdongense]MDR7330331.1 multicomponent Na+:H+ antiporter subunit G [Corynebacterium guangdongense]WJZ18889.1 Na(+)/H(+) antiporter subunit G [Corynebacterium guangdongense]
MTWSLIADIVSLLLILPGAFFVLTAAVGVIRFKGTMAKVHAITKPQTTGILMLMTGTIIHIVADEDFSVAERGDVGMIVLLITFALMTSPVTAQRLGRVSRREGLYGPSEYMSRNDSPADRSMRRH